jgi:pimeloyl-ACP methyl ester carboxylesterase
VAVRYANGTTLRFPAPGSFDRTRRRVTVEVPASLLEGATSVTLALARDRGKVRDQPTGPRYWDGKVWKDTGTIASGKKTLVLIHGIFSSVESSFPAYRFFSGCPQKIADAGSFDQVLGFDYDWFEPPDKEGALFADFLKQVLEKNPSSLTVEAHSYGTLVTLAALPNLGSDAKIANAVTLGGPLPLRGTPLANPKNHWRMGMILGLLAWHFDTPPSFVDKAFDSGMVASLATDSDKLKSILTNFKGMSNRPPVIQAAGTKWICLVGSVSHCAYSEETFKKVLVDGSGVELPWDGVVETLAAESTDIPDAVATPFPLSHVDLECASDVIKWVAKQLK